MKRKPIKHVVFSKSEQADDDDPFGVDVPPARAPTVSKLAKHTADIKARQFDVIMRGVVDAARRDGFDRVLVGREADALVVGIPVPALAIEYLLTLSAWPLGLVAQLVAHTGIGKSALLAEIGRWFHLAGGGMYLVEAEAKFNPGWYTALLQEAFDHVALFRSHSMEHWQQNVSFALSRHKQNSLGTKANPGPGMTVPALIGVDSVSGKTLESVQEKILGKENAQGIRTGAGQGHADERRFSGEAKSLTDYTKLLAGEVRDWPLSAVLINHLKEKQGEMGTMERSVPGGKQLGYQESFEIELSKRGGKLKFKEFEGHRVALRIHKNSFGPGDRRVQTRLLWRFEQDSKEESGFRQVAWWDWGWSLVDLLSHILSPEGKEPGIKANLKDAGFHLDCPKTSDVENLAWSKSLGMEKGDAVPWAVLGDKIQNNAKLLKQLRAALNIKIIPILSGDYGEQREALLDKSKDK